MLVIRTTVIGNIVPAISGPAMRKRFTREQEALILSQKDMLTKGLKKAPKIPTASAKVIPPDITWRDGYNDGRLLLFEPRGTRVESVSVISYIPLTDGNLEPSDSSILFQRS